MSDKTIVIGAGIIGISAALELQSRGQHVRVLDRKGVAAEASQRNAGAFAFADIEPLATPGIMRKAPKWLLDPTGPLSVPPRYALQIAPWLLRFWRASWRDRYDLAVAAQSALMDLSKEALTRQIAAVKGQDLILSEGQLQLYEGEQQYRAAGHSLEMRARHGIAFERLESTGAIAEIQPGLSPQFTHAIYTPDWLRCTDPNLWTQYLAEAFRAGGGVIEQADVTALRAIGQTVVVETTGAEIQADHVVVACGAWSGGLARSLGDRIPLETERGYNTTLPAGAFDLRTQLTFGGHGFVVTRVGDGLRVGGAVELGGLRLPPNMKRADVLLDKAASFMPGLRREGGERWMNYRPSMPDSLPVIGKAPGARRVIYAFGHGHLGLTQSAGTAELIATLVLGGTPPIPLAPYAPNRF